MTLVVSQLVQRWSLLAQIFNISLFLFIINLKFKIDFNKFGNLVELFFVLQQPII